MLTLVQRQPRVAAVSWDKPAMGLRRRMVEQVAVWRSRGRQLYALSRLDDRLLADIGLTREKRVLACSTLVWWHP